MKFTNKAFPQSCRYAEYLSSATIVTVTVTVLEAEQFAFPCNIFFAELQLKKFWAWTETQTGLCWGRIKAKVSDKFQTLWIFNMFTFTFIFNPMIHVANTKLGIEFYLWTWSKVFEICQILLLLFCPNKDQFWFLFMLRTSSAEVRRKKHCREIKIAHPPIQLQGCLRWQMKDICHIYIIIYINENFDVFWV